MHQHDASVRAVAQPHVAITMFAMKKLVLAALIQGASATVLTAETFDAEAFHPTRSAFVLFYAPWCGPHPSRTYVTYTPCTPPAPRRARVMPRP
eukprot:scaffold40591_cov56-Phaeocystis_antarctica.AAC.2